MLADCFTSLKDAIPDWGLWERARAPFQSACDQMNSHMSEGATQLNDMSDGLHKSAAEYRQNEQNGEALAGKIF